MSHDSHSGGQGPQPEWIWNDRTQQWDMNPAYTGQGPQSAWTWNDRTQQWEKNPAYTEQGTPPVGPRQRKTWPWVVGAVVLTALLMLMVSAIVDNESSQDGNRDASGSTNTSLGQPAPTTIEPTPSPPSSSVEPMPPPPASSVEPNRSARVDDSIWVALDEAGVTQEMVAALGAVGDETGYGISKSTPMTQVQREGLAYAVMLLCRDVAAGETSWDQSINDDVFGGAEWADARRFNDFARTEFCPQVRPEAPTTAPARPSVSTDSSSIVLTADVAIDGRTVTVSGAVPLPDGAGLSIALSRIEYFGFGDEKRYDNVDFRRAVVADGRFTAVLLDDQEKIRGFVDAYNVGELPERQIRVSDLVEVSVVFDPREGQPPAVVSAVGGYSGLALASSPQGSEFGSLTNDPYWRLEYESEHQLPFEF